MGAGDDLPPYITFVNQALQQLEQRFTDALERMASKDALELVRAEVRAERAARETAVATERKAREDLQADLAKDETDRATRMRRLWVVVWSVASTFIIATATVASVLLHH